MMSKRIAFVTFILLLFTFYAFSADSSDGQPEITVITINNARQTSYKKADDTGNDTIVLEGSVSLSVQKGNSTNEIKADKITYDRKTEMLYAEGNVSITMKDGASGNDNATADSLLMNTSTLEGVFDGGRIVQTQSDALNLPSGSTLIVFSEMFGKGNENVISFKNSSLTFCDEDPPHWHIDATRTWLLPGGEFAFFNALLYVGVVPVLYFPAFYYPKDELIFNPVFGYSKREGYYVETTTYLWGRKPLNGNTASRKSSSSSSSSTSGSSSSADSLKAVYNFIKPNSLKEQVREGLVLHNLDEDYKGDTSQYVKLMADWYSNLGYMIGIDGKTVPVKNYITRLDFEFLLGFSNTIFKQDGEFYPFSSTGRTYKDESVFLGLKMPFRYSANLDFQLSKPFSLKISLPVYSDPYFNYDFKTYRMETMDWISYFLDQSKNDNTDPTITEVSSFTWAASSSYSPTLPSFIKPYVSSMSLSMNNSVNISSREVNRSTFVTENESDWLTYTPMRRFYYPSLVTPVSVNMSMNGTIFSWPPAKSEKKSTPAFVVSLNKPDELKTEKQLEEERLKAEAEEKAKAQEEEGEVQTTEPAEEVEEEKSEEKEKTFEYLNPELNYTASTESVTDTLTYALTYSLGMNATNQLAYASNNLNKSEDFNWNDIRTSMYNIKVPLSISSKFNYGGNFFSIENKFSFSPVFQKHPYISDDATYGYTEDEKNKLIISDYKSESRDIVNTNSVVFRPFVYLPFISDTNVSWNSNIKLYRRKFTGDNVNELQWEESFADFEDEESITVNSVSADIHAAELDRKFSQSVKVEAVMPPLLKKYTATLSLGFPYVSASISTGFQEARSESEANTARVAAAKAEGITLKNKDYEKEWKKSPLNQSLSISLFNSKLKLSESFTYNLEDNNPDSLKISASAFGLNLSYVMSYTLGYDFDRENGWQIWKEEERGKAFIPYSLSASYSLPAKTFYTWFNRITLTPSLSMSAVADLLRPTNSYLLFSPSIKFKINQFLEVSFSATSRNSVLYWYFHNEEDDLYSEWGGFPGNVLYDLINSFRFDDDTKRQNSGFKLKSFNMSVSHDLHDWKFNMTVKIEPRIITENGKKQYDFKPYITIGVVWNPMESMKTSIIDDYGEWKLE